MATADPVIERLYTSYCAALDSLNLQGPSSIVVALGCGVDSQSVLDMTLRYRQAHPQHRYSAIHLDHFFHPDSPQWAEFLCQHCVDVDIEHIVRPIDVDVSARQSKEAAGREARYRYLAELTPDNAVILLGHHSTDQAETFLLQMKRGAGPKGLSAMAPVAPFKGQRRLCRPLLNHSKAEIYTYARARNVPWIEDVTNADTRIERNFIRHCILPPLRERWPSIEATIGRSARLCAEQQALNDFLLAERLSDLLLQQAPHQDALAVEKLSVLPLIMQKALVRLYLTQRGAQAPSEAVLLSLLAQLEHARARIDWSRWSLRRSGPALHLLTRLQPENYCCHWNGSGPIILPHSLGQIRLTPVGTTGTEDNAESVVPVREGTTVEVRTLASGDTWTGHADKATQSARRLLKKRQVLPWQCDSWPVLWVDGQLAWVPRLGGDGRYLQERQSQSDEAVQWYLVEWQKAD